MQITRSSSVLTVAAALGLLGPVARADVHVVAGDGSGDFLTIQAAVDTSADGDVLLVRSGTYSGFLIDDVALTVVADAGASVTVDDTVEVRSLAPDRRVVLSGLVIATHPGTNQVPPPALLLADDVGSVRVQDCTMRVGDYNAGEACDGPEGVPVAWIFACADVAFSGCDLHAAWIIGNHGCVGLRGGSGIEAHASRLALYDCAVWGARANEGPTTEGGAGLRCHAGEVFASGCTLRGGAGSRGHCLFCIPTDGGDGGDGLVILDGARVRLLDSVLLAGVGGEGADGFADGADGQALGGPGTPLHFDGPARVFEAPTLAPSGDVLTVTVSGEPGDRVYLPSSLRTGFRTWDAVRGVWLVPFPARMPVTELGTIPASGTLELSVPVESLPSTVEGRVRYLQGYVIGADGEPVLGAPLELAVLNCSVAGPDCDGNGLLDTCDLLAGAGDCDGDGVPYACEADCNANGLADDCDLAAGTSVDVNGNGVLDECESTTIWYVSAGAVGGNGSVGAPFGTIAEAFEASISGDEIVLFGGLYAGPENSGLTFDGRDLVLRAEAGSDVVIDAGNQGTAFRMNGVASRTWFEGLTIRRAGSAIWVAGSLDSSVTIVNCRFEECWSLAVHVGDSTSRIEGCSFVDCSRGVVGQLGVVAIVDCLFRGCDAGAVFIINGEISRCVFLDNQRSSGWGGAVYVAGVADPLQPRVRVTNCLFAGCAAFRGGAVFAEAPVQLVGNTFVNNVATFEGGAVAVAETLGRRIDIGNSIFWGNQAPAGSQISVGVEGIRPADVTITSCNVQGGVAGILVHPLSTLTASAIGDVDPLFVDPDGPDDQPGTLEDNDWRLSAGSPLLDAGNNLLFPPDTLDLDGDGDVTEPIPIDLDGFGRYVDQPAAPDRGIGAPTIADIGAYERP